MIATEKIANSRNRTCYHVGQESSCAVCGGVVWAASFGHSLPCLVTCVECQTRRIYPAPSESDLERIYNAHYYQRFGAESIASEYRAMKVRNAELFFERIEEYTAPGAFLDVGCGLGENLIVGLRRGWDAFGVDRIYHSIGASDILIPERVRLLNWENELWDGQKLNLVMFCDVIEHFYRPDAALQQANKCLVENGLLFLTTPDLESIWARLLGHRWWHYHRDHLWYFSHKSLCRLATDAGFEVLDCGPTKKRFALRYVLSILANSDKQVTGKWLSNQLLRVLPASILAMQSPNLTEGLTLIGRKVGT